MHRHTSFMKSLVHIANYCVVRRTPNWLRVGFESHGFRANLRTRSITDAAYRKARAEAMVASKSFASLRLRLIQAKKRSTTHRHPWPGSRADFMPAYNWRRDRRHAPSCSQARFSPRSVSLLLPGVIFGLSNRVFGYRHASDPALVVGLGLIFKLSCPESNFPVMAGSLPLRIVAFYVCFVAGIRISTQLMHRGTANPAGPPDPD